MTTGLVMRNKFILAGFMCSENLSVDYLARSNYMFKIDTEHKWLLGKRKFYHLQRSLCKINSA